MKYLTPCLQVKSIENNGEVSGYASVFNVVDSYGDIVEHGAFKTAVDDFKNGKIPKLLWQHNVDIPIGVVEEMTEDEHGLFVKCRLIQEIPKAKEIYHLLKNKAIDGFSIGYRIRGHRFENDYQYLTDIDLLEISVVTFPACESAIVNDIKSQNEIIQSLKTITNKIKEYTEK
ncbi:MAG: HK97 family phage prohead protease [Alphaproteobacteria bacterium]|nr:HK97 family phage prohead protease [Alphaproteobacteria bacterium]